MLRSNGIQPAQQRFGSPLACGKFDSAIFEDLVVEIPGGTVNKAPGAGRIRFYPGSQMGVGAGVIGLDQDSEDMQGIAEAGDSFGEALAIGDSDDNGNLDLAIGIPGENEAAGAVHIVHGNAGGITTLFSFVFLEDALGGVSEAGDELGHVVVTGDFDDDSKDDLAIGVPYEDLSSAVDTGSFSVVYGQPGFGPPSSARAPNQELQDRNSRRAERRLTSSGAILSAGQRSPRAPTGPRWTETRTT